MSEEIAARVRAAISDHGPIGFDEFMGIALYGPGGFFEAPPIGTRGHFVTSPHVHPFVFSHCIRDALVDGWLKLGEPDPFEVVELGAGDGTLAASLLEAFGELPGPRLDYTAVEISPGARDVLRTRGLASVERLDELEAFEGVVFANELLDNLPFVRARGARDGPQEIRIGLRGDELVEVAVPWPRSEVPLHRLAPGEETTVPVGTFALLDVLRARLPRGYVLLIDYGTVEGPAGGPHGYREHRRVSDVLSDPGATDVTAGVDMTAVASYARSLGLLAFEPVRQADALEALGQTRWERTMLEIQSMLQRAGRGSEAVRVWEARSRASLLREPSGMGGLWWLPLSTPDLPEPGWHERARGTALTHDSSSR